MGLQSTTQWDGLAHAGYENLLYNGVSLDTVHTRSGVTRNSFTAGIDRFISRGVLLDVARLHGVDSLADSWDVTADDLDAAAAQARVEVRSGDIVLVRTGHYRDCLAGDNARFMGAEPGLGISTLEWLHEHEVAAVALDNWACEVMPSPLPDYPVPFHMVAIRDLGLMLGEMFDLEAPGRGLRRGRRLRVPVLRDRPEDLTVRRLACHTDGAQVRTVPPSAGEETAR
jgi:hypothetical protein